MEEEVVLNSAEAAGLVGILAGIVAALGIFVFIIAAVWYILQVVAYWKIFTKAGKPGWHSIIPFLNKWDEIDMSWSRPMAWVWLALTVVNGFISKGYLNASDAAESGNPGALAVILGIALGIVTIIGLYKLAKAFGKGFGFFIGLLLLNPIFMLILGFGSSRYQGRQG